MLCRDTDSGHSLTGKPKQGDQGTPLHKNIWSEGGGARSAHQRRVAPPLSNTQATLANMRNIARLVSQKGDSLAAVTHTLWGDQLWKANHEGSGH